MHKSPVVFVLLAMIVPGCGGGGGGGGGGGTGPGPGPDPSFHTAKGFDCTFTLTRSIDAIVPALDGSGDLYVGGRFTTYNDVRQRAILRLNADGSVDGGFAVGTGFDGSVYSIAIATDGSGDVYAGGAFTSYNGTACNRLVRLNADGSMDAGFVIGSGCNSTVWKVAVAMDGSGDVFVGGDFTSYKGVAGSNRILRLDSDGTPDASFVPGTGFNFTPLAFAPVSDGDVIVGGAFTSYNGTAGVNRIIRLNADGTIDAAFATGTGFNLNEVNALALDASGDVYVGGSFFQYQGLAANRILRLNPDGSRDNAFAIATGCNGPVDSVALAIDGSGDVFVGGEFGSYQGLAGTVRIARINSDGTLDAGFATGTGFTGGLGGDITIRAIAMATDGTGDVCLGGYFTIYNGTAVDHFVRVNSDASLDTSTRLGSGFNYTVRALAAATDGSGDMYAGGEFGFYSGAVHNRLIRVDSNGTADAGFATGTGFNQMVLALATAADGSGDLYVGGAFGVYNGAACANIVRLNSSGTLDVAFNPGTGPNLDVRAVLCATDGSGDVFLGGLFASYNGTSSSRIVRVSPTGALVNAAVGTGFNGDVLGLALAPDGSGDIVAVGAFSAYNGTTSGRIIRLNSDLTLDTPAPGTGLNGLTWSITASAAGLYVGGDFTAYNGIARVRILRLTGALVLDAAFDPGAGPSVATGGASVRSLLVTATGRIYAAGVFETYDGSPSEGIVALNPDGTIDAGFVVGTGLTRRAWALAQGQDANGDLYVGGEFRSYRNLTVDFLVAVNQDGSVD